MKKIALGKICLILLMISLLIPSTQAQEQSRVYTITVDGEIGAGVAEYVVRSIDKARNENATIVIKMDTPGGLLSSTEKIVQRMLEEDNGIAVWVTPRGSWAFSAGTYILLASNVAAMDNGTSIGSAQPRPEDPKVTNAMAQWIEEIAILRGRPATVAREFVINNLTMGPENALQENMIDVVAPDIETLLVHMGLENAEVQELGRGFIDGFLDAISNPQLVLLLFIFGFFGILAEITTPGVGLPGIAGVICLILAFWGMGVLALDYAGLGLIGLGLLMLGYELFTPGFAVFGIGGIIAIALGLIFVGKEPWVVVAGDIFKGLIIGTVVILAVMFGMLRKSLKKPPVVGDMELVGKRMVVVKDLKPKGLVKYKGELWTAVSRTPTKKNEEVVVKSVKGNVLQVKKIERYGKKSGAG